MADPDRSDKCRKQKHDMVHVEIFVGGETGKAVIGSREKQKWIKEYDTYEFESKSWKLTETFFVKIDLFNNTRIRGVGRIGSVCCIGGCVCIV